MDEEEEQYKPRGSTDNPANQTMPSGAGGFLSSLAMGAKGPGAAGGQTIQMSEPMDLAWRMLKQMSDEEMQEWAYENLRNQGITIPDEREEEVVPKPEMPTLYY